MKSSWKSKPKQRLSWDSVWKTLQEAKSTIELGACLCQSNSLNTCTNYEQPGLTTLAKLFLSLCQVVSKLWGICQLSQNSRWHFSRQNHEDQQKCKWVLSWHLQQPETYHSSFNSVTLVVYYCTYEEYKHHLDRQLTITLVTEWGLTIVFFKIKECKCYRSKPQMG